MYKPFSDARLRDLLEIKNGKDLILAKRESETVEYKESFVTDDDRIAKTFAAFANNSGGYIIFGVKDDTREIVGLNEKHIERVRIFDKRKVAEALNKLYSPRITFEIDDKEWRGKTLGLIYIHESDYKPIVAITNGFGGKIREGDIFFSYEARRERIKYAELAKILEDRATRNTVEFMKHLEAVLRIGVENAAIMDTNNGEVVGPKIKSFIVDKELIEDLKFIKEGEFIEKKGSPALKLLGNLYTNEQDESRTFLNREHIIVDFLNQVNVKNPVDYIRKAAVEDTHLLPIYYYIHLAKLSIQEAIEEIVALKTTKHGNRDKVIERLKNDDTFYERLKTTNSSASEMKQQYRDHLVNQAKIKVDEEGHRYALYAIRSLKESEIDEDFTIKFTKSVYEKFYHIDNTTGTEFRKTICHLDREIFRPKING